MDRHDFFNDGMAERIKSFEQMLKTGESFFMDTNELEDIINYYLDFDQYNKASKAIEFGSSIYPFELFYKIKRAEILLASQNTGKAIRMLESAREMEPTNVEIAKLLGDAYSINGKFKKAIDCYLFALNRNLDTADILLRLASISLITHNDSKAMEYINSLPADFVYDEFALQDFMKLFYDFEKYELAQTFLKGVIDSDPYNYSAWYYLGLTYQKSEKYNKGIDAFEYCIAIDDKNTLGHLGKGNCLMELKQYNDAIVCFKNSMDNDASDAEVLCNIAECYENLENLSSARYYYLRAIKADQELADGYFGIAMVYKKQEQYKQAENNLLKAIDLDELESIYMIELAELYLVLDNEEKCLYYYQKAYEIDPATTEIVLDYAQAMHHFDATEPAVAMLENHSKVFDIDHRILYRICSYKFCLGHFEEGYTLLHEALDLNASDYFLLYEYSPFVENIENVTNIIDLYTQDSND